MPSYTLFSSLDLAGADWEEISRMAKTCALLLYFGDTDGIPLDKHYFVWSSREDYPSFLMKQLTFTGKIPPPPGKELVAGKLKDTKRIESKAATQINLDRKTALAKALQEEKEISQKTMVPTHALPPRHAEEFLYQDFAVCLGQAQRRHNKIAAYAYIYLTFSPCENSENIRPKGCHEKLRSLASQYDSIKFIVGFSKGFDKFDGQGEAAANAANRYAAMTENIEFKYMEKRPWDTASDSSFSAPPWTTWTKTVVSPSALLDYTDILGTIGSNQDPAFIKLLFQNYRLPTKD